MLQRLLYLLRSFGWPWPNRPGLALAAHSHALDLRWDTARMRRALGLRRRFEVEIIDDTLWDEATGCPVYGEIDLDGRQITLYVGGLDRAEVLATLLHELVHARLDHARHDEEFKRTLCLAARSLWGCVITPRSAARMPYRELDLFVCRAARTALSEELLASTAENYGQHPEFEARRRIQP